MEERVAKEVRVSGLVQGVFYRASAKKWCESEGLCGWVRNEPNGTVLAHIEGSPESVEHFIAWCGEGPTHASVDDVQTVPVEPRHLTGFSILR